MPRTAAALASTRLVLERRVRANLLVQSGQFKEGNSRIDLRHDIAESRCKGAGRTSGADVERPRGAILEVRGEERRGEEDRRDVLAVSLHGGFHDADDPDVGLRCARECRDVQAPAECRALEDHGGQAFGDDRHLGDVAPVRRDEIAALKEVEPQGPEQVATGRPSERTSGGVSPGPRESSCRVGRPRSTADHDPTETLRCESGRGGGPQEIATRQPCGLDSWKS